MGRFLNPDNSAFQVALNSEIYVDKTGLLEYTNRVMGTKQGYIATAVRDGLENPLRLTCSRHITAGVVVLEKCLKN